MTAKINDAIILLGRLSISALQAGVGKLFEIFGFAGSLAAKGVPFSGLVVYLVILVEILGAAALIFGVRARETGAILLAFTYVATLLSHAFSSFPEEARSAQQGQFFKNLAIVGALFLYFVTGPGRYRPRFGAK
ncbi:DoxX family protein [Rhizobium pusense]|jgi:putative oxidoreductase|uniref:DoxX family protein n=1 Tax=Agrobacterium genomosp. 2 str. CFBP 5494 TaxID=1183436 RepID=A0A9W5B6F7_9HYPH|nr:MULTISPECIES: DoxX family protein [Rhizobium/Agrobacterium group]HCJ71744.1 DoxX family protein [Agrobacterium sp.]MDH0908659.1 DoxX family protein [Agrobacterium pusense]MDH1096160.1 DoxX family protein [Agrobacterium pusense]MDH1111085.1 DoxX family protein [Agrobacterium pusense]MDH2193288.1 DoxX family protein [Agrobacterium pusense]